MIMTENNIELVGETLENIMNQLQGDADILKSASEAYDIEVLGLYSHKMSPNMILIGRKDISQSLKSIERYVDADKKKEEVLRLVDSVVNEIPQLLKDLKVEIQKLKNSLNKQ